MRFLFVVVLVFLFSPAWAQEAEYRLQPGDMVELWVAQQPDLNCQILVAPDGRISLPMAGHLLAKGLTLEQLEKALKDRLQGNFKADLNITTMLANSSREQSGQAGTVTIVGDVSKPGEYAMRPGMTVLHVVALAGGFFRSPQVSAGGQRLLPEQKLQQLRVREARLQAEIDGRTDFAVPADAAVSLDQEFLADIVRQEKLTLDERRSRNAAADEERERTRTALAASVSAVRAQLDLNQEELGFAQQELKSVRGLISKGLAAATRETALERSLASLNGQREQLSASMVQAQVNIENLTATIQNTQNQRRYSLLAEVEAVRQQIRALQENLAALTDASGSETAVQQARDNTHQYIILRSSSEGMQEIPAAELSPVLPGDLIKVLSPFDGGVPSNQPVATTAEGAPNSGSLVDHESFGDLTKPAQQ